MLALYSGFGQIIVANAILDNAEGVVSLLGKRQRPADQTRDTRPARVLTPLHMIGLAGQRADGMVLRSRHDSNRDPRLVWRKRRLLTRDFRQSGPQLPGAWATAIPDVTAKDWTTLGVHRQPYPVLVRLLRHNTRHGVGFDLATLEHHVRGARDRLAIALSRPCLKRG